LREAQEDRAAADPRSEDVRDAERRRIARDLHDGALQSLTHALAVAGRNASSDNDKLLPILRQIGRRLRAAIHGLRLEENGEASFSAALREVVQVHRELTPGCMVSPLPARLDSRSDQAGTTVRLQVALSRP
jgi:signal transduction histidine kinase